MAWGNIAVLMVSLVTIDVTGNGAPALELSVGGRVLLNVTMNRTLEGTGVRIVELCPTQKRKVPVEERWYLPSWMTCSAGSATTKPLASGSAAPKRCVRAYARSS